MLTLAKMNKLNFRNLDKVASSIKGFSKISTSSGEIKFADKFNVNIYKIF